MFGLNAKLAGAKPQALQELTDLFPSALAVPLFLIAKEDMNDDKKISAQFLHQVAR